MWGRCQADDVGFKWRVSLELSELFAASEPSCTKNQQICKKHSQKSELASLKHADFYS